MRKASFLILLTMLCARTAAADTIIIMDDNNNSKYIPCQILPCKQHLLFKL